VVLAGALWSAWRFRRGRMVKANLLIAGGTLVLAASGTLNSVLGEVEAFSVTLVLGISLIFAGFLVASAGPAPRPAPPRPREPGTYR
jgi:drug/metabolite transporter (DMT)-like permease